jgi:L-ascorbate metabolism protein UlaG (beta-lactamase superfamily)
MKITMIGHSTVLIETAGQKILTDPYFGLWGNIAYARIAPPAKTREELKDVNIVLISHNHWDHTDSKFLRSLGNDVPVLAPGSSAWVTKLKGGKNVIGMKTWEKKQFGEISVTAVQAVHIAKTTGYIIESEGKTVYFAGDTYYRPFMKNIGQRFKIDAALMPVTTFRVPMTMGEKSAVHAARDLKPSVIIPIHMGIKPRSPLLRTNHSPEGFKRRAALAGLETKLIILRNGESWHL